ncbi:TIGR00268 family protein [Desulfopila sp. IMCC35008]|uniref:TIGR00268 family protein n=1 Tax=Desulfopila sp. IMCC35008 TaxID=2653858 RepID=UPI0013D3F9B6|nr:TIGR00268 family protein [Desulfopila sp. IMCC35008]
MKGPISLDHKIGHLRALLVELKSVAVAFSGGIDSTVLLDNACKVLPPGKVLACNVDSCLVARSGQALADKVLATHFAGRCGVLRIKEDSEKISGFKENPPERCYICKLHIYTSILKAIKDEQVVLLDGTNSDDMMQDRPGIRAVREKNIKTPLEQCGLTKKEIRAYGRSRNLINADVPSNSCLATRIPPGIEINNGILGTIEAAEEFLLQQGFKGSRVRMGDGHTIIELSECDIERMLASDKRRATVEYCEKYNLGVPSLKLRGR